MGRLMDFEARERHVTPVDGFIVGVGWRDLNIRRSRIMSEHNE